MTDESEDIRTYKDTISPLVRLGGKVETLLQELLAANGLIVHTVNHRIKSFKSTVKKIQSSNGEFLSAADVRDLLGLRIITLFSDEVDPIAEMIEREFSVDPSHSNDRRIPDDPDRFGYATVKYSVTLTNEQSSLTEFAEFHGRCFEIQIRSLLQHAWAEIEHDLGYKSQATIPREMRRRFSRLAGLLEVADEQFVQLRNDSLEYVRELPGAIAASANSVGIDKDSIAEIIQSNDLVKEMDTEIALLLGGSLYDADWFPEKHAIELQKLGVNSIADLQMVIQSKGDLIRRFADIWNRTPMPWRPIHEHVDSIPRGVALLYVEYVLAAELKSPELTAELLLTNIGASSPESLAELTEAVLDVYERAAMRSI